MRSLPNIEPSAFNRGEYVGYAAGAVWIITRNYRRAGWRAVTRDMIALPNGPRGGTPAHYVSHGRTLADLSVTLQRFHREHV